MDEKWKEFIETMNALLGLLVGVGALGYALVRTVQLLAGGG